MDLTVFDNKIFVCATDKNFNYKYLAIDTTTGKVYNRNLTISDDTGLVRPVLVIGENSDCFIVYNNDIEYTTEITGTGGVKYTDTVKEQHYTCITKQDFWRNNPAYFEFELL